MLIILKSFQTQNYTVLLFLLLIIYLSILSLLPSPDLQIHQCSLNCICCPSEMFQQKLCLQSVGQLWVSWNLHGPKECSQKVARHGTNSLRCHIVWDIHPIPRLPPGNVISWGACLHQGHLKGNPLRMLGQGRKRQPASVKLAKVIEICISQWMIQYFSLKDSGFISWKVHEPSMAPNINWTGKRGLQTNALLEVARPECSQSFPKGKSYTPTTYFWKPKQNCHQEQDASTSKPW